MCSRGVFQLRTVKLQFCDWGGSSVGVRELLKTMTLDDFLEKNPAIDFAAYIRSGSHPCFFVEYINGWQCSVPLRNYTADEVMNSLIKSRNQFGQRSIGHSGAKVISARKTIQGTWRPGMWGTWSLYEEEKLRKFPEFPLSLEPRPVKEKPDQSMKVERLMRRKLT